MNNAYIDRTRAKRVSKLAYEKKPYDELIAFTGGIYEIMMLKTYWFQFENRIMQIAVF